MSHSICGAKCEECPGRKECPGCTETNGCPFGKKCFVARYIQLGGMESWQAFKQGIMDEVNALRIDGMEPVDELYPLVGRFVNLEYVLPNGQKVKFLHDDEMYLGAQVRNLMDEGGKNCFGVIAREGFILVCAYGEVVAEPELVVYKRR